jgi:Zn finger protein HypA/HybF involved in hydrogenase expression
MTEKNQGKAKWKIGCDECGHTFTKKIGPNTYEVKCPKCGGYDTEPV